MGVWIKKKGWNNSATSDKPDLFLLGFHLTPSVNAAPLKPVFTSLSSSLVFEQYGFSFQALNNSYLEALL